MAPAPSVSERPRNGPRRPGPRWGAVLPLALGAAVAACLAGEAEPIVRLAPVAGAGPDASALVDGAAPAACDPASTIALYYRNLQPTSTADGLDYIFKVQNRTGAPLPLSSLTARYYFTSELTQPWQTSVYYVDTCCSATRSGFTADVTVAVSAFGPTPTADHVIEVGFDSAAGSLPDGDSVQVEIGFFAPNHSQTLDLTNDYSSVPADVGTSTQWDHCPTDCGLFGSCVMTVYRDGARVWGTPPS